MTLQMCRICGNKEGLLDIFKQGSELLEKFTRCGYGTINSEDFLPHFICQQCNDMLNLANQLHLQNEINVKDKSMQSVAQKQENAATEVHYISDEEETSKYEGDLDENNLSIFHPDVLLNENVTHLSDVEEFASLEPAGFESKTVSTVLASETEDVNEMETIFQNSTNSNGLLGPTVYRSNSVDDIESNESCNLTIKAKKSEAKEDDIVDIGEAENGFIANNIRMGDINVQPSILNSNTVDLEIDSRSNSLMSYMCPVCNETFCSKNDYFHHVNQHGTTTTNYQCLKCMVNFQTRYELACHEATHMVNGSYDCHYCSRQYYASYPLLKHIRSCHSKEEKFFCDICQISYSRLDCLKRHVQQIHTNKKWHCKSCGESFRSAYFLNNHKYNSDCSATEGVRHKKPRLPRTLPPEYIIKVSDNQYKCIHCNALFKTLYTYKNHLLIHEDVRPFQCSTCPKAFRTRYAMVSHERIHTNEKPYKCDICSKFFRQVTHLKHHRYLHMKADMPFKCSLCQVGCITKWKLREHLRRHFTEKAFKCAECPEGFFLKYDLKKHARQVHKRSVVFADSDNEGNQTNLLDFTEGTTETDKTDDELRNRNLTDFSDEIIDIADDEEEECFADTSNSFQENTMAKNEDQENHLIGETEDTILDMNFSRNDKESDPVLMGKNRPVQIEKIEDPGIKYILLNNEEKTNAIAPQENNKSIINETIVDYIDLEEDEEEEAETLAPQPPNEIIPNEIEPRNCIAEEVINLEDEDEDEEDVNLLEPQKHIPSSITNDEISNQETLSNNSNNSEILKTMLLKNKSPTVANELINDYIHLDSSNSCKSPSMSQQNNEEYYNNIIGYEEEEEEEEEAEDEEQRECETITEEKFEITEEKVETFSSFYQYGDMAHT